MSTGLDENLDPLEAWETPQTRAKRESWRSGSQPVRVVQSGPTLPPHFYGGGAVTASFIQSLQAAGALHMLANAISQAKMFQHVARLEQQLELLKHGETLYRISVASTSSIGDETRSTFLAQAQTAALQAARDSVQMYDPVIVIEPCAGSDSIAETMLFVSIREPANTDAMIAAERDFYRALRVRMPNDLTPVVDVVLRFEERPA